MTIAENPTGKSFIQQQEIDLLLNQKWFTKADDDRYEAKLDLGELSLVIKNNIASARIYLPKLDDLPESLMPLFTGMRVNDKKDLNYLLQNTFIVLSAEANKI